MAQHLFNSHGQWIAFKRNPSDKYVFNTKGKWIGWLPWDKVDVVDVQGQYLGTIFDGDRLLRVLVPKYRGYPGYPGFRGLRSIPIGTEDVDPEQLE